MLKLIERDGYLSPYTMEIDGRYRYFLQKERELTKDGKIPVLLCIEKCLGCSVLNLQVPEAALEEGAGVRFRRCQPAMTHHS